LSCRQKGMFTVIRNGYHEQLLQYLIDNLERVNVLVLHGGIAHKEATTGSSRSESNLWLFILQIR
jgi:hypothetical protein